MKLRTCQGACREPLLYTVDHHSYQTLQTNLGFTDKTMKHRIKPVRPRPNIPQVKLQRANVGSRLSAEYKQIPMVRKELLLHFEDIELNHVVLVEDQSAEVKGPTQKSDLLGTRLGSTSTPYGERHSYED
ncbi:uncharacterized protein LOC119797967 [Cyprinodon tularosa]|uniref:uncharacterized protein LOC119797967 n=1 Tax=Cyprinodon tularosa TaxID=77115 RepID=UPI0018E23414|nr:uncharacterized protein LOC119797967 [Cyprinodon tularosa]